MNWYKKANIDQLRLFEEAFRGDSNYCSRDTDTLLELFPVTNYPSVDEWAKNIINNGYGKELLSHHVIRACDASKLPVPSFVRKAFQLGFKNSMLSGKRLTDEEIWKEAIK